MICSVFSRNYHENEFKKPQNVTQIPDKVIWLSRK